MAFDLLAPFTPSLWPLVVWLLGLQLISALVVVLAVWLIGRRWSQPQPGALAAYPAGNQLPPLPDAVNQWLQLKLTAHERLTLFLERIRLENQVARVEQPAPKAAAMAQQLIEEINLEFTHNVVQQVYLSEAAWQAVLAARSQTIAFLRLTLERTDSSLGGRAYLQAAMDFAKAVEPDEDPVNQALDALRDDLERAYEALGLRWPRA